MLDGADWLLEARTAGHYHVAYRHRPEAGNSFRRCCELLPNWNAAKNGERY